MANHMQYDTDALARRKMQLVAQGAAYRSAIRAAEHAIRADLRVGKLVKSVLSHVASAAYAVIKSRTGSANLPTLLPLVVGGISALSKRSLLKPILRIALVLGVRAVALAASKRKARPAP